MFVLVNVSKRAQTGPNVYKHVKTCANGSKGLQIVKFYTIFQIFSNLSTFFNFFQFFQNLSDIKAVGGRGPGRGPGRGRGPGSGSGVLVGVLVGVGGRGPGRGPVGVGVPVRWANLKCYTNKSKEIGRQERKSTSEDRI